MVAPRFPHGCLGFHGSSRTSKPQTPMHTYIQERPQENLLLHKKAPLNSPKHRKRGSHTRKKASERKRQVREASACAQIATRFPHLHATMNAATWGETVACVGALGLGLHAKSVQWWQQVYLVTLSGSPAWHNDPWGLHSWRLPVCEFCVHAQSLEGRWCSQLIPC